MKRKSQLLVRDLDEEIVERLRARAAANRRSSEAEHRDILRAALLPRAAASSLKALLLDMPDVGGDEDFARVVDKGRKVPL